MFGRIGILVVLLTLGLPAYAQVEVREVLRSVGVDVRHYDTVDGPYVSELDAASSREPFGGTLSASATCMGSTGGADQELLWSSDSGIFDIRGDLSISMERPLVDGLGGFVLSSVFRGDLMVNSEASFSFLVSTGSSTECRLRIGNIDTNDELLFVVPANVVDYEISGELPGPGAYLVYVSNTESSIKSGARDEVKSVQFALVLGPNDSVDLEAVAWGGVKSLFR